MTEVVFTQNAGRFKKGQTVDFQPALADFFVSKVKCAAFVEKVKPAAKPVEDDFSDILGVPGETERPKRRTRGRKYGTRSLGSYETQDLSAEG